MVARLIELTKKKYLIIFFLPLILTGCYSLSTKRIETLEKKIEKLELQLTEMRTALRNQGISSLDCPGPGCPASGGYQGSDDGEADPNNSNIDDSINAKDKDTE